MPDRYELKGELGAGGMGVVYRALDRERGLDVALKTFRRATAKDEYRLKREFRALAELSHPNLVALYDLVTEAGDGPCFFTMELIEGVDPRTYCGLQARVQADSSATASHSGDTAANDNDGAVRPDYDRVRSVLRQIAEGVHALHGSGQVHRDLKCGNLLVARSGEVKVLDFGLVMSRADGSRDSFAGHTVGTLGYMSPEQAAGRKNLGPATDWYAVGAILFELLTGRLPFEGPTLKVILDKQQIEAPSPRRFNPKAPPDLVLLCEQLLRMDASERPRGEEVLRTLGGRGVVSESHSVIGQSRDEADAFVGREQELAQLAEDFGRVRAGECRVRVMEGPSGLGKSTLVRTFVARLRAASPDLVFIQGKCREQEHVRFRALDAAIDALCAVWRKLPSADANALLPRNAHALLALFPVLDAVPAVADAPQRVALPTDPDARRKAAVAALREVFVRLADRYPVVLFVDDFQWADRGSRDLLTDLLAGDGAPALLLIVAQREVEQRDGGIVRPQPIDGLNAITSRTELSPLDRAKIERLCRERHPELPDATVDHVVGQCGGSPLFALELAQHLKFAEDRSLKPTLHDVIKGRLARMPDAVRTLAKLLALSEESLPQEVLMVASALERAAFMEALGGARTGRFVRHCAGALTKTYEPYHDQVRAALRAMINAEERPTMHARLAVAWQTSSTPNPAAVAEHWFVAGKPQRAAESYAKAADLAEKALNYAAQANLLARLIEVRKAHVEPRDLAELQVVRGRALTRAGRTIEAAEAYLEAAPHHDDALALQAEAAGYLLAGGQLSRGMEVGRCTLAGLGERMPRSQFGALVSFVWSDLRLRARRLRLGRVKNERRRAKLVQKLETYLSLAKGFNVAAPAYSAAFFAKAGYLASKVGDGAKLAIALGGHAGMIAAFYPNRVDGFLSRSRALAEASGEPVSKMFALAGEAYRHYFDADFRQSLRCAEEALATLEALPERHAFEEERMWMLATFSRSYLAESDFSIALPVYLRELERRGDEYGAAMLKLGAGPAWHLMRGEAPMVRRNLEANGHLERWPGDYLSFYAMMGQANHALYTGECREAYLRLVEGLPAWRRSGMIRMPLGDAIARNLRFQLAAGVFLSASGTERAKLLAQTEADARYLLGRRHAYAHMVGLMAAATAAAMRGQRIEALQHLAGAEGECETIGTLCAVYALRWLRGLLLGGSEGEALRHSAVGWMKDQGIVEPERLALIYCPFPPELLDAVPAADESAS